MAVAWRVEEGIANPGAHDNQDPPQDDQIPPHEDVFMRDQVLVVAPQMNDGEIRAIFLNLDQAITLQVNVVTSQL